MIQAKTCGKGKSKAHDLFDDVKRFNEYFFGAGHAQLDGILNHLIEECGEVRRTPEDIDEYADLLILTFAAAHRGGITWKQLIRQARQKMAENWKREWQKPDKDGVCRHVK